MKQSRLLGEMFYGFYEFMSQEMFEVYFSADKRVTCDLKKKKKKEKRWFKNDLVACSVSAGSLQIF